MTNQPHAGLLSRRDVAALMDRWTNDPAFSRLLQRDPRTALESCGIDPSEELVAFIGGLDLSAPVQELQARLSR